MSFFRPPPLPQLPGGVGRLFPEAAGRLQPADQSQQPFQRASGDGGDQPHQVAGLRERPAALPADGASQRGARQPQHRHRGQTDRRTEGRTDTSGFLSFRAHGGESRARRRGRG